MKKFISIFMKLIIVISIFLFLLITYKSLFYIKDATYLLKVMDKPYIILWLISFLLLLILMIVNKVINKADEKKLKLLKIVLLIFLFFGQILIIKAINPVQITDSYIVNDQAIAIAEGLEEKVDIVSNSYFARYSNNNGCLILSIYVVNFLKLIKVDYTLGFTIFNTLMIDLGILFTYLIGKKVKGDKFATKALMFCVLNPLNYLYIHWPYTVTYSLPFMTLLIFLALLLKEKNLSITKRIIYSVCFGLCLVCGYYIRPTIVIPLVAIVICAFIYLLLKREKLKNIILPTVIIALVSIISFVGIGSFNKMYVDNGDNTFPVTHWIMMGLHRDGTVTTEDNDFTNSFPTSEEKKAANIEEIKKTLSSYGVSGLIRHTVNKIPITWSRGESNYVIRMQQDANQNSLYKFIVGEKRDGVILYCQAFRIVTLILCLFGLIKQLLKNKFDFSFFNILLIFGGILFYIIWEAKSAYSVPFLPFLFILATYGLSITDKKIIEKNKYTKAITSLIFIILIITTMILIVSLYKPFTKDKMKVNDYSIRLANVTRSNYLNEVNNKKIIIKQEFTPKKKFSKISIGVMKISDNPTVNYLITIKDSSQIIKEIKINSQDVKKDYINISVDSKKTKANVKYYIEIKPSEDNKKNIDTISFGYRAYKNIKYYDGIMYLNGEIKNANLYMSVYKGRKQTYINKKTYLAISLIIILIECGMFIFIKKWGDE